MELALPDLELAVLLYNRGSLLAHRTSLFCWYGSVHRTVRMEIDKYRRGHLSEPTSGILLGDINNLRFFIFYGCPFQNLSAYRWTGTCVRSFDRRIYHRVEHIHHYVRRASDRFLFGMAHSGRGRFGLFNWRGCRLGDHGVLSSHFLERV